MKKAGISYKILCKKHWDNDTAEGQYGDNDTTEGQLGDNGTAEGQKGDSRGTLWEQ